MARKTHPDFTRGMKEQRTSIPLLQQRWPTAFSQDLRQVRPLAIAIIATLSAEFGWSLPYTKGVLLVWKQRTAYCNAVLRYDDRIDLDGAPSGQQVGDQARLDAHGTLATIAAAEPASPVTVEASPGPPATANPAASGRRSRPVLTLTSMRAAQ